MKLEFETYKVPDDYLINSVLKQDEPYIINDTVGVKRYKITIEEIEESETVISERMKDMKANTRNMHVRERLREYAKANGIKY